MKLFLSLIYISLIFLSTSRANAQIMLDDIFGNLLTNVSQMEVNLNSSNEFNFQLAICGLNDGNINFDTPSPDDWNVITLPKCSNSECQTGFWYRIVDSGFDENTFSWTGNSVASCVIVPFSGIDINNPIIAHNCSSGFSPEPVAPSINAEANSAVVRSFLLESSATDPFLGDLGQFQSTISGVFNFSFLGPIDVQTETGPTGEAVYIDFDIDPSQWHACTLSIRAIGPESRIASVPALNQWGVIAMATGLLMIGFIILNMKFRKQA